MTEDVYLELCSDLASLVVEAKFGEDAWCDDVHTGEPVMTSPAQDVFDDAMHDVEQLVRKATNYDG